MAKRYLRWPGHILCGNTLLIRGGLARIFLCVFNNAIAFICLTVLHARSCNPLRKRHFDLWQVALVTLIVVTELPIAWHDTDAFFSETKVPSG